MKTEIVILIVLSALFLAMFTSGISYRIGFTHGQIKALTGNVAVKLVVKPDSTRVWEMINK